MTSAERVRRERRVRVALKTAAEEANNALARFLEMTQGPGFQAGAEAVEDMDYVINRIENINIPNTYFYPYDHGTGGQHVKRDITDLMWELQVAYIEEALEEYGEDDNNDSTSDLVTRIKSLNADTREALERQEATK